MVELDGHRILGVLAETDARSLIRAEDMATGATVVIKLLRTESPTPEQRARLEHELAVAADLPGAHAVRPLRVASFGRRIGLVSEDVGGDGLDGRIPPGGLDTTTLLDVAISLAEAVEALHAAGVIHRDLKPANLIVDEALSTVRLVDFGLATRLTRTTDAAPERLEGTLAYLAPEQTGRMNRSVDERADLYALGVTLFQLATGRLPFLAEGALELIHAHLAAEPADPCELNPDLPAGIAAIVLRLMAKQPEDRYQSATGLLADLRHAREQWTSGAVARFELATRDRFAGFRVPERLFGREREVAELAAAVQATAVGHGGLLLLSGSAGIGKTALVNEIGPAIAGARGIFLSRKFDQYTRLTQPIQVVTGLVRLALQQPPEQIAALRDRLHEVVGAHLAVLTEIAPDLELIVGRQPAPPPLGAAETEFRFTRAFATFQSAFARPGSPVIVFLDDLQWAPLFNLKLATALADDPLLGHLLVIGAYRSEEVSESHPLTTLVAGMDPERLRRIEIGPISSTATADLVAATLARPDADLAGWLHELTRGNPFHLRQVLESLAADGLLRPGPDGWHADLAAVRAAGLHSDVVDFLAGRLGELEPTARRVLQVGALVGNRFEIDVVAAGAELSPRQVAAALRQPIRAGLIIPLDDRHELVEHAALDETPSGIGYRFRHDRVQQAACGEMDPDAAARTHLRLGRALRRRLDEDGTGLFAVVEHLVAGAALIEDPVERAAVAQLTLRAGREALQAAAHDAVERLTTAGLSLTPAADGLTFELGVLRGIALAVLGRVDEAEEVFSALEPAATDEADFIQLTQTRCEALELSGRLADSYVVARRGLARLGRPLPADEQSWAAAETALLTSLLTPAALEMYQGLPSGDARDLAAEILYYRCFIAAYTTRQQDLPLIMATGADQVRRHGITPMSGNTVGLFSMLPVMAGQFELGVQYGELALELGRLGGAPHHRLAMSSWVFSISWKYPFAEYEKEMNRSFLACHGAGDLIYAMYSVWCEHIASIVHADDCNRALEVLERVLDYSRRYVVFFGTQSRIRAVAMRRLMGLPQTEDLDVEQTLTDLMEAQNLTEYAEAQEELIRIAVLFGEYAQAAAYCDRIEEAVRAGAAGTGIWNGPFYVFGGIAFARLAGQAPPAERGDLLARAVSLGSYIDPVADLWPDNWAAYRSLVRAELALADGDVAAAELNYLDAIDHAAARGYTLLEAWATELLGRVHLAAGRPVAIDYLAEARGLYLACAAGGKAEALEAEFPDLRPASRARSVGAGRSTSSSSSTSDGAAALDLATVVKASQAIASELDRDRIVERLVAIAVENAGAERGMFVPVRDGEVEPDPATAPAGLVRFVARTSEPVVIADIGTDGSFATDPYVIAARPRSVAALAITRSGRTLGVLYLENRLLAGAFTSDRLELLRLLGAQLAISLENARLYSGLEAEVAERTEQLSASLRELQLMQSQIVESEKLAALGSLVAGVAHEVNTPVGVAVTAASHLADRTTAFTREYGTAPLRRSVLESWLSTVAESGQLILANLSRATELVTSFKQVAVDQSSEVRRTFLVADYLQDIIASLRPNLRRAEVAVHIECSPTVALTSYPGALAQVITNLTLNSLTHAWEEGHPGTIRIVVETDPDGIALTFADDGHGIAAAVLPRIYEPFFTTARAKGGSGLGLHVVHNLVTQRLGGTITVRSTTGDGTRFALTIPNAGDAT